MSKAIELRAAGFEEEALTGTPTVSGAALETGVTREEEEELEAISGVELEEEEEG